jgi:predicted aspartyl protease
MVTRGKMICSNRSLAHCPTSALKYGCVIVALSILACAQVGQNSFSAEPETFVRCSSVRLFLSEASVDIRDQDVKVEHLCVKRRLTTAKVVRKLHTDNAGTVSFAKVTSGHYLLVARVSGQELVGAINLPDFTHLAKCVSDVEIRPVDGSLEIEEKN